MSIPKKVRDALHERAGSCCEICGAWANLHDRPVWPEEAPAAPDEDGNGFRVVPLAMDGVAAFDSP